MNVPVSLLRIAATAAFAIALVACGKQPAPAPAPTPAPAPAPAPVATPAPAPVVPAGVQVGNIAVGTAASPNQLAKDPTGAFGTNDPINAVVSTTGTAASATLAAKWTFQDGQVVDETSQTIAPTGPADTTFTIQKPDGWPVGKYKVEITLDGQPAGSREFEVK